MSRELSPAEWTRPARRRAAGNVVLAWSPLVIVLFAGIWRWGGIALAIVALLAGAAALAFAALRAADAFDRGWLIRRLDAHDAELEDSAGLLFAVGELGPLQRIQAGRIAARVEALEPAALAGNWWRRRIAASWLVAAIALAAIAFWPTSAVSDEPLAETAQSGVVTPGEPRLIGQRVRIVPPSYTGLPARISDSLEISAPTGSTIEWTLGFDPQPRSAAIQLVGGQSLPLARGEDGWTTSLRLDVPSLYRVEAAGTGAQGEAHRLEPIEDAPPQVRVIEPASGLVMMRPGQRSWRVVFEASDDYAVDRNARLTVTTALGSGENVTFSERSRTVTGTGDPERRRFVIDLDLASYGLEQGSDLVAQLTVADTRTPERHVVRGPGVILRWPAPAPVEVDGLDLMAKQAMPAYFRSQRQVIIDTEALIAKRANLSADELLAQSDTIGVDQRLLRLRYGQFVGMEVEEGPKPPPLPIAERDDAPARAEPEFEHHDGDGHDHGSAPESPVFGSLGDVTAEYGHTHDDSEAATLLDPDTRALLKAALDEMWQAEVNLRSGRPEDALPYEYRALEFIKQVQQATRIYLPRIGSVQAPIDMSRRMTGKREGLVGGGATLEPFALPDAVPATAWRALAGSGRIDLAGLTGWVRANGARIRDPLGVLAAIDALRREPDSRSRREQLRGALWVVLTRPPAQVRRRDDGGEVGRRYTRGLR